MKLSIFSLIFALGLHIECYEASNILAVFPFPGRSQYILVQPYLKALAEKGHQVTVISAYPQKNAVENFRDIPVLEVLQYVGDVLSYAEVKTSKFLEIMGFSWYYSAVCKDVLNNAKVQELLKSPSEKFDLVIMETLQTDVLYGLAEHFKAPIIGLSSFGADPYIDDLVDNISPMAYVPLHTGLSTERMNFWERFDNMWVNMLMAIHREILHKPLHDKLYKEYFPNAQRSLDEVRKNFSLILLNQHFSLSYARPYVTNMIEVGGFHIQHKAQKLPQELQDFMEKSPKDVIYFSMGTNIKSEHFPENKRKIILQAFSQLPYQILWKFENPALLTDIPKNVYISSWFPQADILAHPKLKLFITHGGLLSTMEAIYHSKPVLGVPIFFDQFLNIQRARQAGYGLSVDYLNLSEQSLLENIKELMENPKYSERIKEISQRYHDQPMSPMEKALYWTEYVLRHKGAGFLRSPAQYLNVWQRNCWDCLAIVIIGLLFSVFVIVFIIGRLIKLIKYLCGAKSSKKIKKN